MTGLRERKKHETRARLMYAALELFGKHGYDAVTIEQIAERAGVAARTFFRYFESKAAACFGFIDQTLEEARASTDVIATTVAQIRDYGRRVAADPAFYETQVRLTLEHPQVRVKRLEILLAFDDAVAAGLQRERPGLDPIRARLAAYTATHLVPAVMETWVQSGATHRPPDWDEPLAAMQRAVAHIVDS